MRCPPLVLAGALVFWGWHTQVLAYALVMAGVVEAARWLPWRWDLGDRDFNRITDLTSLGLLALIVYHFDRYSFHAIYVVLAQLPFVLYPLLVAQRLSPREGVKFTALFLSVRRAVAKGQMQESRSIDLSYPYLLTCLVSASAGDVRSEWFYLGLLGLVGVALWWHRPRRYPALAWLILFATAGAGGYLGHQGVLALRSMIEPIVLAWFQDHFWQDRNPYRAHTAIGSIGRLKLSDRIVLRVRPDGALPPPALMREASYRTFSHNLWLAGASSFTELEPEPNATSWALHAADRGARSVQISTYLRGGRGLLPAPNGTVRIDRLPVEDLSLNPLGALKVERGPKLVDYRARYSPGRSHDLPPAEHDLGLPGHLEAAFVGLAHDLGLFGTNPAVVLERVRQYFARGFEYRLALRPARSRDPLLDFLERTRSGHCEYFATATVLLLRAAGIPARYATGYSVQEYSELEGRYVVRRRHAHSWALAHVGGTWRDFDTTPALWGALEARSAPWWEPMADLWSWGRFRFLEWRWGESERPSNRILLGVLAALALLSLWRLARPARVSPSRPRGSRSPEPEARGSDSEFYLIEARLRAAGFERARGETLLAWLHRADRRAGPGGLSDLTREVLPLHYAYRFDPEGLGADRREALRRGVARWLERHRASAPVTGADRH